MLSQLVGRVALLAWHKFKLRILAWSGLPGTAPTGFLDDYS